MLGRWRVKVLQRISNLFHFYRNFHHREGGSDPQRHIGLIQQMFWLPLHSESQASTMKHSPIGWGFRKYLNQTRILSRSCGYLDDLLRVFGPQKRRPEKGW